MDTRKLRIVKPPLPAIGVCEGCNSQFKSNKRSEDEVEIEIRAAFDAPQVRTEGRQSKRLASRARF